MCSPRPYSQAIFAPYPEILLQNIRISMCKLRNHSSPTACVPNIKNAASGTVKKCERKLWIKVIRRMALYSQLPVNKYGKTVVGRKVRIIEILRRC